MAPANGSATGSVTGDDHALAARLATEAGELLVELRTRLSRESLSPRALGEAGDAAAHELLMRRLAEERPDDVLLSEESSPTADRFESPRVWIIDPLDGTREYGEVPRSDWAVHVALVSGGEPIAGAVALPARGDGGLTLASAPAPPPPPSPPAGLRTRVVVSRTRPPGEAARIADALDGELVPLGSAGAKAMAVVLGDADVYAHSGGQYEWDSAAPVAVARAAGLHTSRLDGSPLAYNQRNLYVPDLLICRAELADRVIAAVKT
jgi:3'(2'), 5'-bisphosphate nucleotidase